MRTLNRTAWIFVSVGLAGAANIPDQGIEAVRVISRPVSKTIELPGEFEPYLSVPIHAKILGFVETIIVDRGSVVQKGQLLATLIAPELNAQHAEAKAKISVAESQKSEAEARLLAARSTYERMKAASAVPGVIAGNELIQAEQQADAERARLEAAQASIQATREAMQAIEELEVYLRVTAPFSGVITTRSVHPGALVGPGKDDVPMFQLETVDHLRLVVPVPEANVGEIAKRTRVGFTVAAYPGEAFYGIVSRVAHSVDAKTRSMPVELDVSNFDGRLAAGMYPSVEWPIRGNTPVLLVPPSAIVTTSERTFVVRVNRDVAEWVDIKKGATDRDLIEVTGPLKAGDTVLRRGSDETREGTRLKVHLMTPSKR